MTTILSDNVISSLGFTTEENYRNVKQGVCGLRLFAERYSLPEPFMASEIDGERLDAAFKKVRADYADIIKKSDLYDECKEDLTKEKRRTKYTKLEKAAIVSIAEALKGTAINPSHERVLFVLSTTKGNVFLLDKNEQKGYSRKQLYLWQSAKLVSDFFGSINSSYVVSNACISGASALITAQRELKARRFDYAIVTGVDVLSKFIISGFQSFKALSQEACKPFDANRAGLNIGEAVATIILSEKPAGLCDSGDVELTAGAVFNDANHISGPSRTGEGSCLALRHILKGIDPEEIAFVCAHGTATPYNDEMESVALTRAGLKEAPVYSLKGYFGHTLGAAGILESVISTRALKDGTVLKTYGCETPGVSSPLDVVMENRETDKRRCVKMLSGFGGCNAAILFTRLF
jgi:3-oxoacyl-[acyl-carrier-protein] synthase-1